MSTTLRYLDDISSSRREVLSLEFDFTKSTITWDSPDGQQMDNFKTLRAVELQTTGLVKDGQLKIFFDPSAMSEYIRVYLGYGGDKALVTYNPISRRTRIRMPGDDDTTGHFKEFEHLDTYEPLDMDSDDLDDLDDEPEADKK